jgi:ABC-type spermidine/putrescine transport system permease subunit II
VGAALTWRRSRLGAYAVLLLLFLYLPIVTMGVFSFHDSLLNALPWKGFTLRWYERALGNQDLLRALWNSIRLGLTTAVVSAILGTAMALAFRRSFAAKGLVLTCILMPVITPPIVHGVALVMMWRATGLQLSLFGSTLVGHVTFVIPFVFLTVFPRVHRFERSLEEAAMDLGATRLVTFRRITLPLIWPGILAGTILAFALSFDEFMRSFFLIGTDTTLPVFLWSMITNDPSPQPNAVGAIVTVISLLLLVIWTRLSAR